MSRVGGGDKSDLRQGGGGGGGWGGEGGGVMGGCPAPGEHKVVVIHHATGCSD